MYVAGIFLIDQAADVLEDTFKEAVVCPVHSAVRIVDVIIDLQLGIFPQREFGVVIEEDGGLGAGAGLNRVVYADVVAGFQRKRALWFRRE